MDRTFLERGLASGSVGLVGFLVVVLNLRALTVETTVVGIVLGGFGVVVGAALIVGGAWLYRSDVTGPHALRIAGWNALGVVVVGTVLALVSFYPPVAIPPFVASLIVGVSAVAHVLIGVNDVRRIRAEALAEERAKRAREREKLVVLNRLIRHNLRHEAQRLLGVSDRLEMTGELTTDDVRDSRETVQVVADKLGSLHDQAEDLQKTITGEAAEREPVTLESVFEDVAAAMRETYPSAVIEVDAPSDLAVRADEHLQTVLAELVENAIEHTDVETPRVQMTAAPAEDAPEEWIDVRVDDNGPGIPESEQAVLTGEEEITELTHGSGFGLWLVKWFVEYYQGQVRFEEADGTSVILRLERV